MFFGVFKDVRDWTVDRWWDVQKLKYDKRAHFDAGKDIAYVCLLILMTISMFIPGIVMIPVVLFSALAGLVKELYDKKKTGKFDKGDLKWTIIGGLYITFIQLPYVLANQVIRVYWVN